MKIITLIIAICLIAPVQSKSVDNCKATADQAVKIMQYRQNKGDLFAALERYDNKEMVIAAFERPRHDVMRALKTLVSAKSRLQSQMANSRYDEVITNQDNEVSLFKMKYIKLCFTSK